MSEKPILEARELTKAFGGILALNRVSFDVYPGEILGIIGPNGSGKTTLVNCITGFVKMTSGNVRFKGKDITRKPAHKIADMGVTRTFQIMRPYYSPSCLQKPGDPALFSAGQTDRRMERRGQAGRSQYRRHRHFGRDRV